MARDRQRAKQRQAARRAARLERNGEPGASGDGQAEADRAARQRDRDRARGEDPAASRDPEARRRDRADGAGTDGELTDYGLAAGAPPEAAGRSDTIFGFEQREPAGIPDAEDLDDEEAAALEREAAREPAAAPVDPAARDRDVAGSTDRRGLAGAFAFVVSFLKGCWAELQRVQWPGRSQLFTLTGVVLGFVVIAGGYLGLLDFVFYRLIRAILF